MPPSRWGRRATAAYVLLLSAMAGFHSYHALLSRPEPSWWPPVLLGLAWPWSGALRSDDPSLAGLVLAFGMNAGLLYLVASRLEGLAGQAPR